MLLQEFLTFSSRAHCVSVLEGAWRFSTLINVSIGNRHVRVCGAAATPDPKVA